MYNITCKYSKNFGVSSKTPLQQIFLNHLSLDNTTLSVSFFQWSIKKKKKEEKKNVKR
jgi:hypothetical protein